MELIEGRSPADITQQDGPLTPRRAGPDNSLTLPSTRTLLRVATALG
ncbi:hypothetical protein [Streptomyces sp. JNUCC 63]